MGAAPSGALLRRLRPLTPVPFIACAIAAGALAMWGVYFDTAWHRTMGRDSFFSLPHLFIYGGGLFVWTTSVVAITLATRGALHDLGGPVGRLGPVRLPLGFAICALGTLVIMAAVPTDLIWHAVFGKDLLIWSPPHLQGVLGGALGALGILFAIAAQRGRGPFGRPRLWQATMLLPLVDLLHYVHWSLAHYAIFPVTRTPDFYPFLVALTVPLFVTAGVRAVGPWAPTLAGLLFLAAVTGIDLALGAIGFARPAVTPVFAVPALPVSVAAWAAPRWRDRLGFAVAAGLVFALAFTAVEHGWMASVVGQPWAAERVLAGLPASLLAGGLSGAVGWVLGGFLRAVGEPGGAAGVFGDRRRARWAAGVAIALALVGLASTYRPQQFGPPMRVEEFGLVAVDRFRIQEAVFWEALLQDEWPREPRLELRSEGVIDGIPLPVGPTWCAAEAETLRAELPHLRLGLTINGAPVDLSGYPLVRQRLRDGRRCDWVGVVSTRQRASVNRFVYTVTPLAGAPPGLRPSRVDFEVVFKDP